MKFSNVAEAEIDDSEVINMIVGRYHPEDVFPEAELIEWAIGHNFELID